MSLALRNPGHTSDAVLIGRDLPEGGLAGDVAAYGGPLHLVMFGPNGVGKGMRVLVPNLLSIQGKSLVVIDPKCQLAPMTIKYRHETGNDVEVIDPLGRLEELVENDPDDRYRYLREHGLHKSVGFNPLSYLDPNSDSFYEDTATVSEAMIKLGGNDPHWPESAQGLTTGLMMWERMTAGNRVPSLAHVRELLTEAEREDANGLCAGLRYTATQMVNRGHYEQVAGKKGYGYAVADLAGQFERENSTDEILSIQSTARTQTRWLLSRSMREDLAKPGVDFRTLKTGSKPKTVYVILPSEYLVTHSTWLRLVVSESLRANLTMGGRRILMMLDEFAALGYLGIVDNLFGVTRDFRIQMWPVFQDLEQLKTLYPKWQTILGMAGVVQSFRTGDLTTAEWISKRSGQEQVEVTTRSSSETSEGMRPQRTSSESTAPTGRPTIHAHDMFGLGDGEMVTFWAGLKKPFRVYAPFFTQSRSLEARALPNPYHGAD